METEHRMGFSFLFSSCFSSVNKEKTQIKVKSERTGNIQVYKTII